MSTIGRIIKYAAVSLAVIVLLMLVWGVAIEPRLVDYNEEEAAVSNLPAEWEGKRVALIADFQIGMWLGNEGTVKEIVNRLIEERPAAVLIAGDFVYHPTDEEKLQEVEPADAYDFTPEVNRSVDLVRPLVAAGIPTYAVLGNHDYGMGYPNSVKNERLAAALRSSLESIGVPVLENTAVPLVLKDKDSSQNAATTENSSFYLVGIGSQYANNAQPEAALSQVPDGAPRLIFMHNPDPFARFPAHSAPLVLAAHTHGGQVRIPFTEDWSWMALATDEKIQADGWIDGNFGQAGNRLYVNRGIGFSSFPVRINCRPELTIFTLRGKFSPAA